jgi:predicted dehydrogenase
MSAPLSLGLIGVGPMAKLHAAAFRAIAGATITRCASRSLEKAQAFAAENGIAEGVNVERLLDNPKVDGLIVVAPADVMADVAGKAAATGLPLLLEKPVGMDLPESEAAAAAIRNPNMVGLNRRFYEVIREGKRIIDEAGGARFIEVHMPEDLRAVADRYQGKALLNWQYGNSVHLIDLFRYFGGEAVSASSDTVENEFWDRSYLGRAAFAGGARGLYQAQWYAPGSWRVAVYARDVAITYAPIEKGTVLRAPGRQMSELLPKGHDAVLKPGLGGQAEAFVSLIRTGRLAQGAADLADYVKSVRLIRDLTEVGA